MFHPVIEKWFEHRYGAPTDIQVDAWDHIAAGHHLLVSAPTGSGKTLAAFLWAIDRLLTGVWPAGAVRVLYISPLKALNNDVRRNLLEPLAALAAEFGNAGIHVPAINVLTRSGDTPQAERQRLVRRPPEILITTPESLNLILVSPRARSVLSTVESVILDEIHAVAGTKRGTHLMTAVERLALEIGEFQRTGLSATVRPLERVAEFIGGYHFARVDGKPEYEKRSVEVVSSAIEKRIEVSVRSPMSLIASAPAPQRLPQQTDWQELARALRVIIDRNHSTLVFTNNRRHAERITMLLNEGLDEPVVYAHHGSLSREIRSFVDQELKSGNLRGIVATSSLELGIDIGDLDEVVLAGTPGSSSSALQRIGRSGHQVNAASTGTIVPLHGKDYLFAAVMAKLVIERRIEELTPITAPLDVLSQVILSTLSEGSRSIDELYDEIRSCYSYHDLQRSQFNGVVQMLGGRYADTRIRSLDARIHIDALSGRATATDSVRMLLYLSGGTIPDRGTFELRLAARENSSARIGELDEEFVWERRIGDVFSLGAQAWKIVRIGDRDVEVMPWRTGAENVPFWKAEAIHRDFETSERILECLETWNQRIEDGESERLHAELEQSYSMDGDSADVVVDFLSRQRNATGTSLPHRHRVVIERYLDPRDGTRQQIVLHTLWGGRVNHPFAIAFAAAWRKEFGSPIDTFADNDCIMLVIPDFAEPISPLISGGRLLSNRNFEALIRGSLEQSGLFGAIFRECAGRALLLPRADFKKRMPLWITRLRSRRLLESIAGYPDFPILAETWRTCLNDEFDLSSLAVILDELETGVISVSEVRTSTPSPFASSIIWQETNSSMYASDETHLPGATALSDEIMKEVLHGVHLRPRIPNELVETFRLKMQRLLPGYAPDSAEELVAWIEERILLPTAELHELRRLLPEGFDNWVPYLRERIYRLTLPGAVQSVVAVSNLHAIFRAFELDFDTAFIQSFDGAELSADLESIVLTALHRQSVMTRNLDEERHPPEAALAELIAIWLRYLPVATSDLIGEVFGLAAERVDTILRQLADGNEVVVDLLTPDAGAPEAADAENLEMMLRALRRERRERARLPEPLSSDWLPCFLSRWQGVGKKSSGTVDDLKSCLEPLLGFVASCALWEREFLPARIANYQRSWLDSLIRESGLSWVGSGPERTTFMFEEEMDLLVRPNGRTGNFDELSQSILAHLRAARDVAVQGLDFWELVHRSNDRSEQVANALWALAWAGQVTSDTFEIVRRGIGHRFSAASIANGQPAPNGGAGRARPVRFDRWQASRPHGRWLALDQPIAADVIGEEERLRDIARQLLSRYGILFRELLAQESTSWSSMFRTLRLMELSGELVSGYFMRGPAGVQFTTSAALELMASLEGGESQPVFWMNACDPASPCGLGLSAAGAALQLPPRVPSNHLVYHGKNLVLVSRRNCREIEIAAAEDDSHLPEYLQLFHVQVQRDEDPLNRVEIETVNGVPVRDSPFANALVACGFRRDFKSFTLQRSYR